MAGMIVFLVALSLCLAIALASGAPLISGIVAGIVGGVVIGALSGSHTSVSGPAAGLTAIVASQIVYPTEFPWRRYGGWNPLTWKRVDRR